MLNQCRYLIIVALVNTAFGAADHTTQVDMHPQLKRIFFRAAQTGNSHVVRTLLQRAPQLCDVTDAHGNVALHIAITSGSLPVVQCLFPASKNCLEKKNNRGFTPLWIAAYRNASDIACFLVDQGADVHVVDYGCHMPIHSAAFHGAVYFVRLLVQYGAVINCSDVDGDTPLHLAARKGQEAVVRLLVAHGAEVNAQNNKNETPLHAAVESHSFGVVRILVQSGADLHAKAHVLGNTPLAWACLKDGVNYPEIVRYLVAHGSPVDSLCKNRVLAALNMSAQTERKAYEETQIKAMEAAALPLPTVLNDLILDFVRGSNPGASANPQFETEALNRVEDQLTGIFPRHMPFKNRLHHFWQAARQGNLRVVRAAIQQHPRISAYVLSARENVALHYAVSGGSLPMVEFLANCGVQEINKKNCAGVTPFWIAADRNLNKIVRFLVSRGADINTKDKHNRTPLHCAALHGASDLVRLFVCNGAVVNCQDDQGCTPLHVAVEKGHLKVVTHLLKLGAEVNVRNKIGETPLHRAALAGSWPVVRLLVQHGADICAKDCVVSTPLLVALCASSKNQAQIVRYLIVNGARVDSAVKDLLSTFKTDWAQEKRMHETAQRQALKESGISLPRRAEEFILEYVRGESRFPEHPRPEHETEGRQTKRLRSGKKYSNRVSK